VSIYGELKYGQGLYDVDWTTPKTNWTAADKYNANDLNRVESNTDFLSTFIALVVIPPVLATRYTTWDRNGLVYYDVLNRIENNIKLLKEATGQTPSGWIEPKVDWISVYDDFSFVDANRLESNLAAIKAMIDLIVDGFRYCGTFSCGEDFAL